VKFSESGDQLCGRVLALLPMQSENFAALPPHFLSSNPESVSQFENVCTILFGEVQNASTKRTIPYLVSSLIYHYDFLQEKFHQEHPIQTSALFTDISSSVILELKRLIFIDSDHLIPRGIPTAVVVLKELKLVKDDMVNLKESQKLIQLDQEKLTELIPLSAAASGMMCGERQLNLLKESIGEHLISALSQSGVQQQSQSRPASRVIQTANESMFLWSDGISREIPETFKVMEKKAKVVDVWNKWLGRRQESETLSSLIRPLP